MSNSSQRAEKGQLIGHGSFRYSILLICALVCFAGIVGFTLWTSYSSQLQVRNTARELFVGESAKRAMAVSFYFSKRVAELDSVAASYPVRSLTAAAAGAGVKSKLIEDACVAVNQSLAEMTVDDEQVFSRIVLLDRNGHLLVDSDRECVFLQGGSEFETYRVRYGSPAFFAGDYGGELSIVVSVPVIGADGFRGSVVGWTRVESLYRSLGDMTMSPSIGSDFLRIDKIVMAISDQSARQSGELLLMDVLQEWQGLTVLKAGKSGRKVDYLAISSPVQGTSLSIISLVEERKIFGFLSLKMQLYFSIFLFVTITCGCFWLVRVVMMRKIYETRMREASKREREVNRQKEKLEFEIRNRQLADALRQRAEIRYRDIFDNAPVGICQTTMDGRFLTVNRALAKILGYEDEEALTTEVSDIRKDVFVNAEDWDQGLKMLRWSGKIAGYEAECRRKDGNSVWTSRDFRLVESDPGMPAYLEEFVVDITSRKLAEQELQRSERRFRSLFANSPVASWELDLSVLKTRFDSFGHNMEPVIREEMLSSPKAVGECVGQIKIIDANNQTIDFVSALSRDELIYKGLVPYVTNHSWRFFRSIILDLLKGAHRHRSEFSFLSEDGREQFFIINLNIVPGCESTWERVLVTVEDISELKRIEAELRVSREEAQKANDAKGRFLANMTHEFRTPMNAIKGMVQLLQGSDLSVEQRENLRLIKSSVDSLLVIVNDILDYSKLDSVHMELNEEFLELPGFLQELRDIMDIGAMNKTLDVVLETEEIPSCIIVDSLRLRQVLVNLLGNAVKFTDEGTVFLRCRPAPESRNDGKTYLHFEVSDTGIGLPENAKDTLFKSFVQADPGITRRYGGTGLGLAICYKLVKHLGGELTAGNNDDGGAVFSFVLPVGICGDGHGGGKTDSSEKSPVVDYSKVKVLVAEDSRMNQILLRKVFEKNGIRDYVIVENGKDAVDAFTESDDFDIILMDIQMPVMDGFEAARAIRKTYSPIRIVALTANSGADFLELCHESGIDSRITKPFNVDELLAELAAVAKR